MTFFADLLGGYDSNLAPEGSVPVPTTTIPASGFTGLADLVLRYWHGQAARHIEVEGRGYLTAYQLTGVEPLVGQNLRVRGQTMFDRKTRLEGNAYFTRDPFLGFGGYDALPISADAAALANPANGLTTGLSWSQTGIGAVTREWTRQARTTASYDYTRREYVRVRGSMVTPSRARWARTECLGDCHADRQLANQLSVFERHAVRADAVRAESCAPDQGPYG